MLSAVLLLAASAMCALALDPGSTTIEHGSTKWMKTTENPSKPSEHFWSSLKHLTESTTFKPETTVSPMHYTVTERLVSDKCDCVKTWDVLEKIEKSVEMIKENFDPMSNNTKGKLAKPCLIEVTSVSELHPKVGSILINNVSCIECNSHLPNNANNDTYGPGMSICVFDPATGHIVDKRHFLTGLTNNTNNETINFESMYLTKYLEIVKEKYAVVGTTCGDAISGLTDDAKVIFKVIGVDLEKVSPNDLLTFAFRPMETNKRVWDWEPASVLELKRTYELVGNTTEDYSFEKIEGPPVVTVPTSG